MKRKRLGNKGELVACTYLLKKGFEIIEKNYFSQYGEIDIIAKKDEQWHFVEVKTRQNLDGVILGELLSGKQKISLNKTISVYLGKLDKVDISYQLDLLVILFKKKVNKAKIYFYEGV